MTHPLCSILLPTRKRLPRLLRCMQSIVDSAQDKACFEFCLRLHRDDKETLAALTQLCYAAPQVRIVIGPPERYGNLARLYDDCADIAHGKWVWVMNDDVVFQGQNWDVALAGAPADRFIVLPETSRNGGSTYVREMNCPFMWVPNKCWRQYGIDRFQNQFDSFMWQLLRNNGWGTHFLPDLTVWHDRDEPELLQKTREADEAANEHHMENL